jgi:hypothetical protein
MKSAQRSRIADIGSEVTTKGYFGRAQQRAVRRKSPWNLLDLPVGFFCMALAGWAIVRGVWALRNLLMPQQARWLSAVFHSQVHQIAHIVFFVASLFACVPIGMLMCNVILWCIPAYRREADREAKSVWHASFLDAQKDLSLLARCIGIPAILVSFAAALVLP